MRQPIALTLLTYGARASVTLAFFFGLATTICAETALVQLRSGRFLSGNVDSRTSDDDLWLYASEDPVLAVTTTPWDNIVAVRIGKKQFTAQEFRNAAVNYASAVPPLAAIDNRPGTTPRERPRSPQQIARVEILATLSNWDADVEPDGLEMRVRPLTSDGEFIPVDGLLNVRVMGRRTGRTDRLESVAGFGFYTNDGSVREYAPQISSARYVEVGRWSERLRPQFATDAGYMMRLPFRNIHPEYDLDIALDGLVESSLSVKGQKVFVVTDPLQLRQFNPMREEMQLNRGTRFFPRESRGR